MVEIAEQFVTFKFFRPAASNVQLAGEFNNWRLDELPLNLGADGWWRAEVLLPPGTYRFRYWADGCWFTDFAAFGLDMGPYGMESVVRVPNQAQDFLQPISRRLGKMASRGAGTREVVV